MVKVIPYAELEENIGFESDWTEWFEVKQEKINEFAEATGDRQWIHIDIERAKKGPFGGTIAHGYYTVSLLPVLSGQCIAVSGVTMGVNYGVNKIRFPAPVPVGKRIRAKSTLTAVKNIEKPMPGKQMETKVEVWVEGNSKPSMVAETISRLYAPG
jgi:acyl dehydratase